MPACPTMGLQTIRRAPMQPAPARTLHIFSGGGRLLLHPAQAPRLSRGPNSRSNRRMPNSCACRPLFAWRANRIWTASTATAYAGISTRSPIALVGSPIGAGWLLILSFSCIGRKQHQMRGHYATNERKSLDFFARTSRSAACMALGLVIEVTCASLGVQSSQIHLDPKAAQTPHAKPGGSSGIGLLVVGSLPAEHSPEATRGATFFKY